MNKRLRALMARRVDALELASAITDSLGDDDDMSDEQRTSVDAHLETVKALDQDIEREEALAAAALVAPAIDSPHIVGGELQAVNDPKRGFSHFGDFACASVRASNTHGARVVDERVLSGAAPTTCGPEAIG